MTTAAKTADFTRENIMFASGGVLCAGWVYRPTSAPLSPAAGAAASGSRKYPAMVLGHGLGAVKEMGLDRYASVFTALGVICVAFDYRHFGESEGSPRQLLDINLQLEDWKAALNYTTNLDDVDSQRIGIFGSSFGGGHVISVAAKDKRVKAAISQCPFTSGLYSCLACGPAALLKLSLPAIRDLFSRGDQIVPVPLITEGGKTGLLNGYDVSQVWQLVPDNMKPNFKDYVAARIALHIGLYHPGWKTSSVTCPIFFAVCGKDSVAPAAPTLSYAKNAPKATIKHYEQMGHFDIYLGSNFEIATKDYAEFLRQNL